MSRILSRRRFGSGVTRRAPSVSPVAPPLVTHRRLPAVGFGEATLVWSCLDCPALAPLDPLPSRCPDCGGETAVVVED